MLGMVPFHLTGWKLELKLVHTFLSRALFVLRLKVLEKKLRKLLHTGSWFVSNWTTWSKNFANLASAGVYQYPTRGAQS